MISINQAKKIAKQYADENKFLSAPYTGKSYMLSGVIECYVFDLLKSDDDVGEIQFIGPPEMLFVSKNSGQTFVERLLI
ncbi:hypothetical protein [Lacticaseibacillus paracasei]|uniref:hypothetical protein n=1 Tax=Lacticaseibacillus paracasei TaxID=1597 RepID=UPI002A5ACB18|nr:hypothetical protein [Lacticaseibacillus paracasei]MDY0839004.1 hypothetical protein [Lacticaseibacillus paracasei]